MHIDCLNAVINDKPSYSILAFVRHIHESIIVKGLKQHVLNISHCKPNSLLVFKTGFVVELNKMHYRLSRLPLVLHPKPVVRMLGLVECLVPCET